MVCEFSGIRPTKAETLEIATGGRLFKTSNAKKVAIPKDSKVHTLDYQFRAPQTEFRNDGHFFVFLLLTVLTLSKLLLQ